MTGIGEERPDHPRGARREQSLERPLGRPQIGLAFLFDQDIAEGEITISRQVEVSETVTLEQRRPLGADVLGNGDRIGSLHLRAELPQPGNGLTDLLGLTDGSDFEKQRLFFASELEFHQEIGPLALDLGPGRFLPGHSLREQLPKPLGRRSPDFLRNVHRFTGSMIFSVR